MNDLWSESANRITEAVNNFIQRREYFIAESHSAQLFPDLFNRIHFRSIWRYEKQFYIFWNAEGSSFMPGSSVAAQENDIVWILPRQFRQENIHTGHIAIWHDQKTGFPGQWFYRAIYIAIFPNMVAGYRRSKSFLTPTVFWLVDPPKSCLILKHQPNIVEIFLQFCNSCVNFFETSMISSAAFFGCLLRGITFLHPCRCNTR